MSYELTQDLYLQIRSFLRYLAVACCSCMRRNLGYCESCNATAAKHLGEKMDAGIPPPSHDLDTSLSHRMEIILDQMRKANRPIRSIDIDTRDYCSKELKAWTLDKLISLGKIKSVKQGYFYLYSLVDEKTKRKK